MCCTVILTCIQTFFRFHLKCHSISCTEHSLCHTTDVSEFSSEQLDRLFYCELCICSMDDSSITFLSTHCSIKRCLLYKDCSSLSICNRFRDLTFCCKHCDLRITGQCVISDKFGCDRRIDFIIYSRICTHIVCLFAGFSCLDSLFFHCCLETFLVNSITFFFQNLFCQIKWKSISIIQFKCIFSRKYLFSGLIHLFLHHRENMQSLIDCLVKLIFLLRQHIEDKLFLFI